MMEGFSRRIAIGSLGSAGVAIAARPASAAASVIDRATYESYIAAFNARDIPGFTKFYAPDATFLLGPMEMHGRQAIIDWYHLAWTRLQEHCTVRRFIADASGIAVELETQFTAIADWPDFSAGPLLKGDVLRRIGFAHYDNGPAGFSRVATAPHRVLQAPDHWPKRA
jgi:hypothetical protein